MTDQATLAANTLSGRYTELPKTYELVFQLGIRPELIYTYAALSDFANNKTGECYPQMRTIAGLLGRSVRTVQRHLHELQDFGLIEFAQRLRDDSGRYRGYLYRILHTSRIAERRKAKRQEKQEAERRKGIEKAQRKQRRSKKQATGHESPVNEDRITNRSKDSPHSPPTGSFKEDYEWFFREPPLDENEKNTGKTASSDIKEGYEWFFGK
ncbi:MAG: helix-turn-helix domain-containing protein [Rubrobacter sp.]|nr:helix-turn-helix domain-containing protein [Rubrobacter sp.]